MLLLFSGPGSQVAQATGGLVASGVATVAVAALGSGGLALSGTAPTSNDLVGTATGGLVASGTAAVGVAAAGTGGLVLSGSSPLGGVAIAQATGGLVASGSARAIPGLAGLGGPTISGAAAVTGTPSLPPDLMAAILAAASADPALAAIDGGFWRGKLPPDLAGAAAPARYCVYTRTRGSHLLLTSTSEVKDYTVRFRVYAADGDECEALGQALIVAARAWGPLKYRGGVSLPLIEAGGLSDPTRDRRPGDKAAWHAEATFSARCVRAAVTYAGG